MGVGILLAQRRVRLITGESSTFRSILTSQFLRASVNRARAIAASVFRSVERFPNDSRRHAARIDDAKMAGVKAAQEARELRGSGAMARGWPPRTSPHNGEVFEIPSPILLHQFILGRLHLVLSAYVQAHGGSVFVAPVDIVLSDYDVVQPDVLLFMPEREHLLDMRTATRHAPDLAIEILSPGTSSRNDRGRKLRLFERHRVQEYLAGRARRAIRRVYRLSGTRLALTSTARDGGPGRVGAAAGTRDHSSELLPNR